MSTQQLTNEVVKLADLPRRPVPQGERQVNSSRVLEELSVVPSGSEPPGSLPKSKRVFDCIVALVLLIVSFPVVLLAALLVKLTSRGPAIYSQIRLGLNGKPFWIHKLRTMVKDSEPDGAQWSKPGDMRVTMLGKFLRRAHLDELPQLWNVLRGEMSLVGPRPERPEFVPSLSIALPGYRNRMLVRPGVTGLAQVQLPPDTDIESVRRKLACDLEYAKHPAFWLDIKLIVATVLKIVGVPARWRCKLLRIPFGKAIPGLEQEQRVDPPSQKGAAPCPQTV